MGVSCFKMRGNNKTVIIIIADVGIGADNEFCHLETFRARCRQGNDVVVMETASFGRMRVGRCITSDAYLTALQQLDPTSLGCSADVLRYMDRVCSGRPSCDVSVASPQLHEFRPCPGQLTMYLEATYSCLSGRALFNAANISSYWVVYGIPGVVDYLLYGIVSFWYILNKIRNCLQFLPFKIFWIINSTRKK